MEQGPSVGRIGIPNEVGSPGSELAEPTVACGLSRTRRAGLEATLQDENGTDGGH